MLDNFVLFFEITSNQKWKLYLTNQSVTNYYYTKNFLEKFCLDNQSVNVKIITR